MSRDPFLRLALVAASSGYLLGLILVARTFGWQAALLVGLLGVLAATLLTIELDPSPPSRDELKEQLRPDRPRTDRDGRPQGFERISG